MKNQKRVVVVHPEDESEGEALHSPSLLTTRARRKSVDAGSMLSARKSMEREEERNYTQAQGARKAINFARDSVASHLVTIGSMFVLWDDGHEGYLHRDGFVHAMAALGSEKRAAEDIFDELDEYGTGKIHYGAYLECALRDGLSQIAPRLVQLCPGRVGGRERSARDGMLHRGPSLVREGARHNLFQPLSGVSHIGSQSHTPHLHHIKQLHKCFVVKN